MPRVPKKSSGTSRFKAVSGVRKTGTGTPAKTSASRVRRAMARRRSSGSY